MAKKNTAPDQEHEALHNDVDELVADNPEEATSQTDQQEDDPIDENVELRQQVGELKEKYIRLVAEFENYKKRTVREKLDWMKTAAQDTIVAMLPVLDDFDRAKKFADGEKGDGEGLGEGVELVYQKLYTTLKNRGLEPMESTGELFDPELHEAITEMPAPSEEMKGKVFDTIEKGYRLNDKIIRHAKVVVSK